MLDYLEKCYPMSNTVIVFMGAILSIGTILSYLPQHYRIISNMTSQGFSPWFFLFGVVSLTSRIFNVILLQWNSHENEYCFEELLELTATGAAWAMFCSMFYLFLLCYPEDMKKGQLRCTTLRYGSSSQMMVSKEWRDSLWIAVVCVAHFAISFFVTVILLGFAGSSQDNQHTHNWANFLSGLSMLSACLQYLPQVWKTWRLKTVGALSIFTLILQTSGPFLPFYLFFVPPGTSLAEKVTYMTHGTLQTTLLVLCVVWHYRNKRLGIDDLVIPKDDLNVPGDEDVIDERARLLR